MNKDGYVNFIARICDFFCKDGGSQGGRDSTAMTDRLQR